jgi:hypothetical protein
VVVSWLLPAIPAVAGVAAGGLDHYSTDTHCFVDVASRFGTWVFAVPFAAVAACTLLLIVLALASSPLPSLAAVCVAVSASMCVLVPACMCVLVAACMSVLVAASVSACMRMLVAACMCVLVAASTRMLAVFIRPPSLSRGSLPLSSPLSFSLFSVSFFFSSPVLALVGNTECVCCWVCRVRG